MKKTFSLLVLCSLLFVACQSEPVPVEVETPTPESELPVAEENDTVYIQDGRFHDPESGISFDVPEDATYIDVRGTGPSIEKVVSFRIQNYDPMGPDKLALSEDEYYLELTVDYQSESSIADCESTLTSIETVEANEGTRVMGSPDQGGDSGGERYAICFNEGLPSYYLQITENNPEYPVREMIKESFFQM